MYGPSPRGPKCRQKWIPIQVTKYWRGTDGGNVNAAGEVGVRESSGNEVTFALGLKGCIRFSPLDKEGTGIYGGGIARAKALRLGSAGSIGAHLGWLEHKALGEKGRAQIRLWRASDAGWGLHASYFQGKEASSQSA